MAAPATAAPSNLRLLTVAEAAAATGRTEKALRAMLAKHQLPATRVGGRVYFLESVLANFLAEQTR